MFGIQPAGEVQNQWTGFVAPALQAALHALDQVDIFFNGGGAVLDGKPADRLAILASGREPAAPDGAS